MDIFLENYIADSSGILYLMKANNDLYSFFLDGKNWIFQSDKYRWDMFQPEPTTTKPVQYSGVVVLIISERFLPQAECPIANRHVQYPDGFA